MLTNRIKNNQGEIRFARKRLKLLPPLSENELSTLEIDWANNPEFVERKKIIEKYFRHGAVVQLRFVAEHDNHAYLKALAKSYIIDLAKIK